MANMREISGRMKSIRDTMKITNAMYMISSTKMRKAKRSQEGNSPYFSELQLMYDRIIESTPELDNQYLDERPMKKGKERTRAIIVITADKGMAGAYNHNVLRIVDMLMREEVNSKLYVIGEVGRQAFAGQKAPMEGQFKYTAQNPSIHRARVIGELIINQFLQGELDEAYIVYTEIHNSMTSEAKWKRLLPLARETKDVEPGELVQAPEEINFVPSAEAVLNHVVPDMVVGQIYSALVEAYCSEQNDRMLAMDAANKNAQAMIHELSIEYNRVRQAMITQEITEVIAGAKAQKKKKKKKEAGRT
ncbi:MAG: ATP synthase F1 subunit gamma [Lachnospiraceae bacterium]|nr:ATP synthase F1 subunit gamma [Lachnospiraceae bacterium]